MLIFFCDFLLKFSIFFVEIKFILFKSLLKGFYFLFVSVGLWVKHLPYGCFLFDELLNFNIFLLESFLWLRNLILEAINIFLMTDFDVLNLRIVHLCKLKFKGLLLSFKKSLIFYEFSPNIIIFLFQNIDRVFIMSFLFEYFSVKLLRLKISLIEEFFEFEILWLDIVNWHHMTLFDCLNFIRVIRLKFQSHRFHLFFSVLFNIN